MDTRLFVALLGADEVPVHPNAGSEHSFWITPEAAARAAEANAMEMMTVTRHNPELPAGADPAATLQDASRGPIRAVEPKLIEVEGRMWLSAIDDEGPAAA